MALILVRYGEIGLKSRPVRSRFERKFISNIQDFFVREKIECLVSSDWGRIYIRTNDTERALHTLKHIFGIVSASVAVECTPEVDDIVSTISRYAESIIPYGSSFAIRCRRTGDHNYTSMQIAEKAGTAVLEKLRDKNIRVNLDRPDVEIGIDIRKNKCYVYHESIRCAGGMPLGTQGSVVAIFKESDDKHSAVAAWMMMKRGCRTFIVADSTEHSDNKNLCFLKQWDVSLNTVYSRADIWVDAVDVARKINASGIVTTESPLTYGTALAKSSGIPVFYPLFGLSDEMVNEIYSVLSG